MTDRPKASAIAQRELRNDNAKVMDAVSAGETFVVTRNGEDFRGIDQLVNVVEI